MDNRGAQNRRTVEKNQRGVDSLFPLAYAGGVTTTARSRRSTSRRKGDANERAILQTAERLLAERPVEAISVADLAAGAGISRSSFYFYFGSKRDVLLSLLDATAGELGHVIEAFVADIAADPRGRVTAAIEATADLFRRRGATLAAIIAAAETDAEVREIWEATIARFVDLNAAMIAAERGRGAAPDGPDPRELATALVWMNERVLHVARRGRAPAPGARTNDVLAEIWLRAIYGRADV